MGCEAQAGSKEAEADYSGVDTMIRQLPVAVPRFPGSIRIQTSSRPESKEEFDGQCAVDAADAANRYRGFVGRHHEGPTN